MSVGNNIKVLRQNFGLTQKDLADELNVSFQSISKWEKDEVEPDISTLGKLAKIFSVSLDELVNSSFTTVSQKNDSAKEDITKAKSSFVYNGEKIRSEKNKAPKIMMIISIITLILGIMTFVVCLIASKDTTQVDVIHIGDNTTIVKKNYDTGEIGGGLMIALSAAVLIFAILTKKDFIEIDKDGLTGYANMKNFKYNWEDIKCAKASLISLNVTTLNNEKSFPVLFIKNAENIAKKINEVVNH